MKKNQLNLSLQFFALLIGFASLGALLSFQKTFTPFIIALALYMYIVGYAFIIVFTQYFKYAFNKAYGDVFSEGMGKYFQDARAMVADMRKPPEIIMTNRGPVKYETFQKMVDNPCPICKSNMEIDPDCSVCNGEGYVDVKEDGKDKEKGEQS
jgi:hypothetical protein